jgi:hypothetical protein
MNFIKYLGSFPSTPAGRIFQYPYEVVRQIIITGACTATGAVAGAVVLGGLPITMPTYIALCNLSESERKSADSKKISNMDISSPSSPFRPS